MRFSYNVFCSYPPSVKLLQTQLSSPPTLLYVLSFVTHQGKENNKQQASQPEK